MPEDYNLLSAPNQVIVRIFSPSNLDEDCDRIGNLLSHISTAIEQDLYDGNYRGAVLLFLQEADSLCSHFMEDRHWEWYDDMYSHYYILNADWQVLFSFISKFSDEVRNFLRDGLVSICETEAVRSYSAIDADQWLDQLTTEFD